MFRPVDVLDADGRSRSEADFTWPFPERRPGDCDPSDASPGVLSAGETNLIMPMPPALGSPPLTPRQWRLRLESVDGRYDHRVGLRNGSLASTSAS